MRLITTLLATLAVLFPLTATADWNAGGTGSTLWTPTSVASGVSSTIVIPDAEASGDWSAALEMKGDRNTVCINTDTDVVGIGAGAVTMELYWTGDALDRNDLNSYVPIQNAATGTIVTLSSTVACVPGEIPRGFIRGKITTLVDQPGKLIAR